MNIRLIGTLALLYPFLVWIITVLDYKIGSLKRHSIKWIDNPTEKDMFKMILKVNLIELAMLFVGILIGSLI